MNPFKPHPEDRDDTLHSCDCDEDQRHQAVGDASVIVGLAVIGLVGTAASCFG